MSSIPGTTLLSVALGNQYNALEEFSKAVEIFEAAVKNGSSNPFVYMNLSTSYGGLGDFVRAAAIDKEYLDNFGDLASVRMDLASTYFGEGKWDLALAEIDKGFHSESEQQELSFDEGSDPFTPGRFYYRGKGVPGAPRCP